MARYIDADEFRMWLANERFTFGGIKEVDGVFKPLAEFPSADVAPVVHAHWKLNANKNHDICTNCGTFASMWFDDDGERIEWLSDYCPNCGAKMDEEVH